MRKRGVGNQTTKTAPLRGAFDMDIPIPRASARGCVQGTATRLYVSQAGEHTNNPTIPGSPP
ncbi:hypothetical protein LJC57_05390 [Parabacteroides sp. OttesenSCG-928-G07]|nr:hypothetical protein [Parabacteroides sp. OttesenSCG-928-G21]MDL2278006.1 hypothetical protein [Parabacteroides sp. OttesenSCG-928-G07]